MSPYHGSNAPSVVPSEQVVSSSHSIMDDDESSSAMEHHASSLYSCGAGAALVDNNNTDIDDDVSIAVFSQDDFQEETWTSVVRPTHIVAVAAGVGLLTATPFPLLLFSFYATALGAASIMSHAHELLQEEYDLWKHQTQHATHTENETETTVGTPQQEAMQPEDAFSVQDSPTATAPTADIHQQQQQDTFVKSCDEEETPSSFLTTQFPPLDNVILSGETFQGLNGKEFFHVFLSDEAPFSFSEFQTKRGDINIQYESWQPLEAPAQHVQHLCRKVSFQTKTKSYFGPPFASCTKYQQVFISKRCLILEQKVVLSEIPFSDCFYVKERWMLSAPKSKIASLQVSSQVIFEKSCTFSSQIQSKSVSTLREVATAWCSMAQQALTLTKQRKRLQQQQQVQPMKSTGSVEVTHSECSKASIVVGDHDENKAPYPEMVVAVTPSPPRKRTSSLKSLKRSVLVKMTKRMNQE